VNRFELTIVAEAEVIKAATIAAAGLPDPDPDSDSEPSRST
jgi:hypothetical protein